MLPISDVSGNRNVYFASEKWLASIYCQTEYDRPSNGEKRYDWMCFFSVVPRLGSEFDLEDTNKTYADEESFTFFQSTPGDHDLLGIEPAPIRGNLFKVYGNQLNLFAQQLPGPLVFQSALYRVEINCRENYLRPSNGEARSDHMCEFNLYDR